MTGVGKGPCTVRSNLNKFEHVQSVPVQGAKPGPGVPCTGGLVSGLRTLYYEVQCIMGNGHI